MAERVEHVEWFEFKTGSKVPKERQFVRMRTMEGSTIFVRPMPWGILLEEFRGFTLEQKQTWDLEHSTFRQSGQLLCLFVPNLELPGGASIPLASVMQDSLSLRQLNRFVTEAREVLGRQLPLGITDAT